LKLWQFDPADRNQFRKNMREGLTPAGDGVRRSELHKDAHETVSYWEADPGASLHADAPGGV
jgi:hypothetical protein